MIRLQKRINQASSFFQPAYFIILCMMVCLSCDRYDYRTTIHVENAQLKWGDTLSFSFPVNDTVRLFDLFLEVDHHTNINCQNVYFKVNTFVDGEAIQEQIVSLELANAKGYWLGDCNEEDCHRIIPFMMRTSFDKVGTYTINLQQYSRDSVVTGFQTFSLGLKSSENVR